MINTISDVLTRITTIEQQAQSLQSGTLLDSALGVSGGSAPASSGSTPASGSSSPGGFANQLASAQAGATPTGGNAGGAPAFGSLQSSALWAAGSSAYPSAPTGDPYAGVSSGVPYSGLGAGGAYSNPATGGVYPGPATGGVYPGPATGGVYPGPGAGGVYSSPGATGIGLPSAASGQLTASQQQFASTFSADTGLNPNVVSAWLLAEESGGAAQSREAAGNNDWLNVGYTDSGTYGAGDTVWSDPTAAANATAAWLRGQDSIPGYGTASAGIQSILATVGQAPAAQIQAIQGSGWSSGGYPSLGLLYSQVTSS